MFMERQKGGYWLIHVFPSNDKWAVWRYKQVTNYQPRVTVSTLYI